jgi:hypothetical protein
MKLDSNFSVKRNPPPPLPPKSMKYEKGENVKENGKIVKI